MTSKSGTSIRVDKDTHQLIKDIAYLQGESMAEVITVALEEYLFTRSALRERLGLVEQARTSEHGSNPA